MADALTEAAQSDTAAAHYANARALLDDADDRDTGTAEQTALLLASIAHMCGAAACATRELAVALTAAAANVRAYVDAAEDKP